LMTLPAPTGLSGHAARGTTREGGGVRACAREVTNHASVR
jgi:hypothetical protein